MAKAQVLSSTVAIVVSCVIVLWLALPVAQADIYGAGSYEMDSGEYSPNPLGFGGRFYPRPWGQGSYLGFGGGFYPRPGGYGSYMGMQPGYEFIDWGDVADGTQVDGIEIGYYTNSTDPITIIMRFYSGENGGVFTMATEEACVPVTLPGFVPGTDGYYIFDVDLRGGWEFAISGPDLDGDGKVDIGYGFEVTDPGNGTVGILLSKDNPDPPGAFGITEGFVVKDTSSGFRTESSIPDEYFQFHCGLFSAGEPWEGLTLYPTPDGSSRTAAAEYDAAGRLTIVTIETKDSVGGATGVPEGLALAYDQLGNLTRVIRSVDDVEQNQVELLNYPETGPQALRKRPGRTKYSSLVDKATTINQTDVGYDCNGRLTRMAYQDFDENGAAEWGYIVENVTYDSDGRVLTMSEGKDNDCDDSIDVGGAIRDMAFTYSGGKLDYIHDSVSSSNVLTWNRAADYEQVIVTSAPGDSPVVCQVDYDSGRFAGMQVNGTSFVTAQAWNDDGFPMKIRNWNWWGDASGPVSADFYGLSLTPGAADSLQADRMMMALINGEGESWRGW
ncbi:MAG: hypothetical protein KAV82_01935 [Phycisphaerae bacterium]|nr:hypothetical protein [Phycisphaerae bacterium]